MNFVQSSDEQPLKQRTVTREGVGQSNRTREVQVTGTAEVCWPADRASVRVSVRSSKESVSDVSNSVSRRLQYIVQVLRRRACVSAVENAQQKAGEVSRLLGQSLGPPLLVREEETKEEWRNEEGGSRAVLHPQFAFIPTVSACSRVSASFSLRATNRKNL